MSSTTHAPPSVLTIHEAADYLRVSTRTLYAMTRPRGPIQCLRVGPRGVRYTVAALQRFIADQEGTQDERHIR
jgi:excisionase family DNA binding protein